MREVVKLYPDGSYNSQWSVLIRSQARKGKLWEVDNTLAWCQRSLPNWRPQPLLLEYVIKFAKEINDEGRVDAYSNMLRDAHKLIAAEEEIRRQNREAAIEAAMNNGNNEVKNDAINADVDASIESDTTAEIPSPSFVLPPLPLPQTVDEAKVRAHEADEAVNKATAEAAIAVDAANDAATKNQIPAYEQTNLAHAAMVAQVQVRQLTASATVAHALVRTMMKKEVVTAASVAAASTPGFNRNQPRLQLTQPWGFAPTTTTQQTTPTATTTDNGLDSSTADEQNNEAKKRARVPTAKPKSKPYVFE
jgi:hypothetical protein